MDQTLPPSKSQYSLLFVSLRAAAISLFLFLIAVFPAAADPTRYFVKPDGTGAGLSWPDASGDLQAVINASQSGDEIWVAGGTYKPASGQSFSMKEGVKIYGNFAGTEASFSEWFPTIEAYKSTLQGNGSNVLVNFNRNLTNAAELNNFTITGATGAAILNFSSNSPKLVNLVIAGNISGGGIYIEGSSPLLVNCAIRGNKTLVNGGGISIASSASPVLVNCYITGNIAANGGGIAISNASPILISCLISGNTATTGAGIYNNLTSAPVLTNCTIAGNTATGAGGGMNNLGTSSPKIRNSIIHGNSSGISNDAGSVPIIQYSMVQGINSSAPADHNLPGDLGPLFVDAANGNYHLQYCSAAVDKASNSYFNSSQVPNISAFLFDLDYGDRFFDYSQPDMGAYEFQDHPTTGVAGVVYVKEGGTGSGASWDCAMGNLQFAINASVSGGQVWVASGTYKPASGLPFNMKEGVKIYGGFAGTEASVSARNLSNTANKSTLQGNGSNVLANFGLNLTNAAVLDGFTITGASGTGILNFSSNSPKLVNLTITGNTSGGGIYIEGSSPVLVNCAIYGNNSSFNGGGLLISSASPILVNCAITGNTAANGAGMASLSSSPVLTNCTIAGNTASIAGSALYNINNSSVGIRNSIIHGNSSGIHNDPGSSAVIQYSLVQGETATDPLFVDAAGGDYRLQPCSPVINKGYNFFIAAQIPDLSGITTDLDHHSRIFESAVDMGAYEFGGASRELAVDGDEVESIVSGDLALISTGPMCHILALVSPNGGAPLNGTITAKVWVAGTQPANYLKRHYQIAPETDAEHATAKVTLYFTQQEFDDFNAVNTVQLPYDAEDYGNYKPNLLIEKRSGVSNDGSGLPNSYTGTISTFRPSDANGNILWNADASRWEVSFDVTGFSGFFVKTNESSLPLHLINFSAHEEAGSNLLQWSTASEVNTDNFEIQRSSDARKFVTIGTVYAGGSGDHQYSYNDRTSYSGAIYYRLKMSDLDKSFTYSKIVSLAGDGSLVRVYPNPAAVTVTFKVGNALLKSTASLYDISGRKIQTVVITANQQSINIKSLARGLYILKFADGTAERFVKE